MTSNYQLIKYRLLVPSLIKLVKLFRKDKSIALKEQPFFILGSGRNGSTLLASIINSNKGISIPPEQYVIPYSIMEWYLKPWTFSDFSKNLISNLLKKNKTSNWDFNKEKLGSKLFELEQGQFGLNNVIDTVFKEYSGKKIKLWGDKTPLNTHFIEYIYDVFPKGKYIMLLRDPRDVVLSYSKMPEHPASNPRYATWKWNDSLRTLDFLERKKARVLLVKYEDLVTDTDKELTRISEFLNIEIRNEKSHDELGVSGQKHHENLSKPISSASIGKWKKELPSEVIDLITPRLRKNMKRFNY